MNGDFDTLKFCGGDELVSTIIAGIITKISVQARIRAWSIACMMCGIRGSRSHDSSEILRGNLCHFGVDECLTYGCDVLYGRSSISLAQWDHRIRIFLTVIVPSDQLAFLTSLQLPFVFFGAVICRKNLLLGVVGKNWFARV